MTDLSKIDWSKCESRLWSEQMVNGELRSTRIRPVWDAFHRNPILKLGEPGSSVAALTGYGWQLIEGAVLMTIDQVEFALRYMKQVDAFVEQELKRMDAERCGVTMLEIGWYACSLEEATANADCSQFRYGELWLPMKERVGNGNAAGYRYRTRAQKAEPKMPRVEAPEGTYWLRIDGHWWLADKCDGQGIERVPASKLNRDVMLACIAALDEAEA